ncbi:MAG: hypothetical protein ACLQPH_12150, partial [Acidimicrobiales bacterium]
SRSSRFNCKLSERVGPDARRHGWTEETQFTALKHLEDWRSDLLADGRIKPDHALAWDFWYDMVGLHTKTTDERDDRLELIRDVDLYVSRMYH